MSSWVLGVLAACLVILDGAFACTVIAVGREASATGFPIVTHSDDSGHSTSDIRFVRVPRKKWPPGSKRPLYQWSLGYPRVVTTVLAKDYEPVNDQVETVPLGYIPQIPETWAYWDTDYGVQNEHGLSIGESTCTSMTMGWPTSSGPHGYNRVGIEDLSKIALERCKTARCAVETMGEIAVTHGFYAADGSPLPPPDKPNYAGGSECLVLADAEPGDVWTFNIMTGKGNASAIWAAQRMPPNHITAVGNAFTIRKMNLSDNHNFLYSPGVSQLAQEMGWWTPVADDPDIFDFFGSYGYLNGHRPPTTYDPPNVVSVMSYYSGRRLWRIFSLLSPVEGAKLDPNLGNLPTTKDPYPNSVPAPKGSVTLRMVMDAHRDHYEGTPYDLTKGMAAGPYGNPDRSWPPPTVAGQWERAISMFRTSWSFVLEAKSSGRSRVWFAWDAPHGSVYLPFYGAATEPAPESYHSIEGFQSKFSTKVAWWAFNVINEYEDKNYGLINPYVRAHAHEIENDGFELTASWEAQLENLPASEGIAKLTALSNKFVESKVDDWWSFGQSLHARYARLVETFNESAVDGENFLAQAPPEWWLKSPEVGFTSWTPQGRLELEPLPQSLVGQTIMHDGLPQLAMQSPLIQVLVLCAVAGLAFSLGVSWGKKKNQSLEVYVLQP